MMKREQQKRQDDLNKELRTLIKIQHDEHVRLGINCEQKMVDAIMGVDPS
jgi:hypothetical protein